MDCILFRQAPLQSRKLADSVYTIPAMTVQAAQACGRTAPARRLIVLSLSKTCFAAYHHPLRRGERFLLDRLV